MAIRVVEDLGAPITVVAVDLITESAAPDWNEWASYIMAGGGYIGAWMGWGGPFLKNVGIASLPWAAKKIYDRVKGGAGAGKRLSFKRSGVSQRWPAPSNEPQFGPARLV